MNINKTTQNTGQISPSNNSNDKIQSLEQRKNQLTQELSRIKSSNKNSQSQQQEAEKKVEQLNNQIKNINQQIAALKSQNETIPAEKVAQTELPNKTAKDNSSTILTESKRFDRYVKDTSLEIDKLDNTYHITEEDGKKIVKFNNKNEEKNQQAQL